MNKSLPVVLIPKTIADTFDRVNPSEFVKEDLLHLFGILLEELIDGREVLVITHAYAVPGLKRFYAHVNTAGEGVLDLLQIINNGLSLVARALKFNGTTCGSWHTHPDSIRTGPSRDDVESYRNGAKTARLPMWLSPIACREPGTKKKYTDWMAYLTSSDSIVGINGYILQMPDDDVAKLAPGINTFMEVDPGHFLSHVHGTGKEESHQLRSITSTEPLCPSSERNPILRPERLNRLSYMARLQRIDWAGVGSASLFWMTVMNSLLLALVLRILK